jgi:hypothetical protein
MVSTLVVAAEESVVAMSGTTWWVCLLLAIGMLVVGGVGLARTNDRVAPFIPIVFGALTLLVLVHAILVGRVSF